MPGDLTRAKSNKGSVDGQFSREFLHRPVRKGQSVGFCAGRLLAFSFIRHGKILFCAREPQSLARVPQHQQDCPARGSKLSSSKAAASEAPRRYKPYFVRAVRPYNRSWRTENPLQCFRLPRSFSSTLRV